MKATKNRCDDMSFSDALAQSTVSRKSGASEELRELTMEMENAVIAIIDAVDHIFEFLKMNSSDTDGSSIRRQCTRIMEACTFQDIVGQRLVKVSRIISDLEGRETLSPSPTQGQSADNRTNTGVPISPLLDGPALPGEGLRQEDVERIWDAHAPADISQVS